MKWSDGERERLSVIYVYILIDVSKEEEIIVMRATEAKGAFRVAKQRLCVIRWQKSASRSVGKKKGSARCGVCRCTNVHSLLVLECTANIRIPNAGTYVRPTRRGIPVSAAAINLYVARINGGRWSEWTFDCNMNVDLYLSL